MAPAMTRVLLLRGDITTQEVDAIVNAANESLARGGGVCGAIHRAGGAGIARECAALAPCPTGQARTTSGGRLPARWVVHAVGPAWRSGGHGEAELLASAWRAAVAEAARVGARSLAFPAISCGIYGYPLDEAARVAVAALRDALGEHPLDEVRLVMFDEGTWQAFREALGGEEATW